MAKRIAPRLYEIVGNEVAIMKIFGPADPLAAGLGNQNLNVHIDQAIDLNLHNGYNSLYIHLCFPTDPNSPGDYTIDFDVRTNGNQTSLDSIAIPHSSTQSALTKFNFIKK
jgi:hypothetical protein